MPTQLIKLNSIFNESFKQQALQPKSTPIGCFFKVVPNPTLLDKWRSVHKHTATLFVQIDSGVVSISNHGRTATATAADVRVVLCGKKEVQIQIEKAAPVLYAFDCELSTIEFIGAVHLIQHIEALQSNQTDADDAKHDMVLMRQLQQTLQYATEMWSLALWHQLFPYSPLLPSLDATIVSVQQNNVRRAKTFVDDLHAQFYIEASVTKLTELNTTYFQPSHVALLAAKLEALSLHLDKYL
ncbi:Aste57867_723 [Aphanomyces stellatus]|uniref:Aste57867_723 protein n=1 Tax=Aphanomyces stellatus TaxID=120398 RepID=A0A485K8D1_9STRA|nr:hypothetical protein As57867_000722 [Aphanomyces stellatus]VFT77947.1 Aste57867_723 [Aphanomyces stellatus]